MSPTISVVMCTFNGARFLQAQLDSLMCQTRCPQEMIVQDDCSSDTTVAILERFANQAPFKVDIRVNDTRTGLVRNFAKAVDFSRGDYVALADQDDVWHQDKLLRMEERVRTMDERAQVARLLHCDMRVTNAEGKLLSPSFFIRRGFVSSHPQPIGELLVQNYVTGCASFVNRALIDIALPIPDEAYIHDWWFALIGAAAGSVETILEPLMDYRAHGANMVGAKRIEWRPYLRIRSARKFFGLALVQGEALARRLKERRVSGPAAEFVHEWVARMREGGWRAAVWNLHSGARMQQGLTTAILGLHILLGTFKASVAQPRRFDIGTSNVRQS